MNSERGAALSTVIIMGLLIGILALSTYKYMDIKVKQTRHMSLRREAQYAARAGLEMALFGLRNKTSDSLEGIVDPAGNSAGFQNGDRFLNVDHARLSAAKADGLNRRTVQLSVVQDGITSDGLRNRYKIMSKTKYVE